MKSLSIAWKDIQLAVKDPGTWVSLFLLPLLFIFIFAGGLGALAGSDETSGEEAIARIQLPVVNLDEDGPLSQLLLANLAAAGTVQVESISQEEAEVGLDDQLIRHVLFIPASFSEDFAAGTPSTLRLISQPGANMNQTEALRLAVDGVVQDLALEQQLIASLEQMGAMQATAGGAAQDAFGAERIVAQAQSQFERSQGLPLVSFVQVEPGLASAVQEEKPRFISVQTLVPGLAVLFIFLTAQVTARSIYDEKAVGSFRRLLAAPMSKSGLLAGKMLPNLIVALTQFVVIFAAAVLVLPLVGLEPLTFGSDLLALVLLCLLVAICSTSLGILISAIARTESQIGGLSSVAIWVMGFLGGAIIPPFLLSDVLDSVARIVPQYWAVNGFYDLFVLNGGLTDVLPALGMLLLFSVLFFAVGAWRFEFN
jgi:ABC-2 type transport system permease protein